PGPQLAAGWPWLLYLGGIATAGAYAMYTVGLRHVPASVAGVTTLLEPLTATILGVALFGERLGARGRPGPLLLPIPRGPLPVAAVFGAASGGGGGPAPAGRGPAVRAAGSGATPLD